MLHVHPRWGLILCAFGIHAWSLQRGEARGFTDDSRGRFRSCRRCGAHQ